MSDVVQKLWGFCHTLRHDGIDYGDYIEQITFLLFLKMADEKGVAVPKGCDWPALRDQIGSDLLDRYTDILRTLGKTPGILSDIYAEAQSRFNNPVNLKRLINLIDETEWTSLGVDVKAQAYEGLLEKAASEGKKGAGQYFTPRVLIQSVVHCVRPDPPPALASPSATRPAAPAASWSPLTSGSSTRPGAAPSTATPPAASARPRTTARTSSPARAGWH